MEASGAQRPPQRAFVPRRQSRLSTVFLLALGAFAAIVLKYSLHQVPEVCPDLEQQALSVKEDADLLLAKCMPPSIALSLSCSHTEASQKGDDLVLKACFSFKRVFVAYLEPSNAASRGP